VKDARCVRSISATQTNCVHPHRVCSRFALAAFAAGTPHGVSGSVRHDRGTGRFTTSETASADRHPARDLVPLALRRMARARALSSRGADAIEPLTPLSRPAVQPRASLPFGRAASWPRPRLLASCVGRRLRQNAETIRSSPRVTGTLRDDPGCLPSTGDPSQDPVVLTTPVPRPLHRFWRCRDRWMALSRHPGPGADPLPTNAVSPTHDEPFARRACRRCHPPTFTPS